MGAWGPLAFDNDKANDWAYGLENLRDLSLVEDTISQFEESCHGYLSSNIAVYGLAACEVVARLQGHPGYQNAYTKKVDVWVAANPLPVSRDLKERAVDLIDRTLGEDSELRELWEDNLEWLTAMIELRRRVMGSK